MAQPPTPTILDGRRNMMRVLPEGLHGLRPAEAKKDLRLALAAARAQDAAVTLKPPPAAPAAARAFASVPPNAVFSLAAKRKRWKRWDRDPDAIAGELQARRDANEALRLGLLAAEDAFAAAKFRFSQYRSHLGGELDAIARQRAYAVEAAAVAERVALRETRGRKPDLVAAARRLGDADSDESDGASSDGDRGSDDDDDDALVASFRGVAARLFGDAAPAGDDVLGRWAAWAALAGREPDLARVLALAPLEESDDDDDDECDLMRCKRELLAYPGTLPEDDDDDDDEARRYPPGRAPADDDRPALLPRGWPHFAGPSAMPNRGANAYLERGGDVLETYVFSAAPTDDASPRAEPAEGSAAPPAEGSAAPPAEDGAAPPAEESAAPPAQDGAAPPAEESAAPPAEDGAAPPAEESAAAPAEEGKAPPPSSAPSPEEDKQAPPAPALVVSCSEDTAPGADDRRQWVRGALPRDVARGLAAERKRVEALRALLATRAEELAAARAATLEVFGGYNEKRRAASAAIAASSDLRRLLEDKGALGAARRGAAPEDSIASRATRRRASPVPPADAPAPAAADDAADAADAAAADSDASPEKPKPRAPKPANRKRGGAAKKGPAKKRAR